jgi:hypothetical protein
VYWRLYDKLCVSIVSGQHTVSLREYLHNPIDLSRLHGSYLHWLKYIRVEKKLLESIQMVVASTYVLSHMWLMAC